MAGYQPSTGPVSSMTDPSNKAGQTAKPAVNWSAMDSEGGWSSNDDPYYTPSTVTYKQNQESAQKSAAASKSQTEGYYQASSWGRSSDASQAYLQSLRDQQLGIQSASAANQAGFQKSQMQGADALGRFAGRYGTQASQYNNFFGAQKQAELVGRQGDASSYLYDLARGGQPSVAQMQMQQGQRDAMAANLAIAGSGRGGSAGAALDQAVRQNSAMQQGIAAQGAQLRAQESLNAMQAAAAIDAARYGQTSQGAAMGLQAAGMQGQALQGQLAARSGAFTGMSDMDLAYRGLGRSYEDLVYGQGNSESERYLGALTGKSAQDFQASMAARQQAREDQAATIQTIGQGLDSAARVYDASRNG